MVTTTYRFYQMSRVNSVTPVVTREEQRHTESLLSLLCGALEWFGSFLLWVKVAVQSQTQRLRAHLSGTPREDGEGRTVSVWGERAA